LETEDYKKNKIDTAWLEKILSIGVLSEKPPAELAVVVGAVYKAFQLSEKSYKELLHAIENGRILKTHYTGIMEYEFSLIYENIKYQFKVIKTGLNAFGIFLNDWYCDVEFNPLTDGGIYITLGGRGYVAYGHDSHSGFRVMVNGQTCVFSKEYDPSELRTEMAGKLIRYLCNSGEHMTKGSPYAEMEVMKMCIPLFCPESGVIETLKPEGSIVAAGDLLAGLKLDDPNKVKRATLFEGSLKVFEEKEVEKNCYVTMKDATDKLKRVLAGFKARPGEVNRNLNLLMNSLRDYRLPMYDFEEVLSVLVGRIPGSLHHTLTEVVKTYSKRNVSSRFYWESPVPFPALEVENAILEAFLDTSPEEKAALQKSIEPIRNALGKYVEGSHGLAIHVLTQLLETYLAVEEIFMKEVREDFALQELRAGHKNDSSYVASLAIAHSDLRSRNDLVIQILDIIISELQPLLPAFHSVLTKLSLLQGSQYSNVVWKSRQLLLKQRNSFVDDRITSVKTILLTAINAADVDRLSRLQSLVEQSQGISDILLDTCLSRNEKLLVKCAAAEVYIRRTYRMYNVLDLKIEKSNNGISASWSFSQNQSETMLKLRRVDSFADMRSIIYRRGHLFVFESWDQVKEQFEALLSKVQVTESSEGNSTVIHIALQWIRNLPEDSTFSLNFYHYLKSIQSQLLLKKVRRVTFTVSNGSPDLSYFTYRESAEFSEDQIIRHVEPTMARQMELERLSNYSVSHFPTNSRIVHLFTAIPKDMSAFNSRLGKAAQYSGKRLFARVLIKKMDHYGVQDVEVSSSDNDILVDTEYGFVQALRSLEFAIGSQPREYQFNHVFLNYLVEEFAAIDDVTKRMRKLLSLYEETMRRLHVSEVELRLRLRGSKDNLSFYRFICSNSSGYYLDVDPYFENHDFCFEYIGDTKPVEEATWHGKSIDTVYPLTTPFQFHRQIAHHNESVWAYDFLILIRQGLRKLWIESEKNPPKIIMQAKELVLDGSNNLVEVTRNIGSNTIGMIAWILTLFTPEYPEGRNVILIANDITFKAGSFGPEEDVLFKKASELARKLKIPRLYFSANSGARIGLASELMQKFKVCWTDNDPTKGLEYLYLSEADYKDLSKSIISEQVVVEGETRYIIRDIIGREYGIGVENLSGSGMIAGETSRAYDEVFTLSYVSGRTVGIGAYLVRLGQRVIQKIGQPILLTGFRALNKLLGKEVYNSNTQLGGTGIMYPNGVSHIVVQDDMEGVIECLRWLSYVPATSGSFNPIVPITELKDPVQRKVKAVPYGNSCDPRDFIAGIATKDEWIPGIFDKDSFKETLGGWAQTIVCGRARLGGIPVGIISVETRTKERTILADPANPDSKEFVLPQAGQVWFPDSSFKTSQAIFDMNREGLPLFILANWRGFSGGMRDMFDEILKYGSYIVDGLREYRQPVFVYLVPHGELRGGAWVVLDSTINPRFMEMYADPTSRGGILEPAGILDIKFRESDVKSTSHRLDSTLQSLKHQLSESKDPQSRSSLEQAIRTRERQLHSAYHQVAMKFADLHDTPGRMLAVNSINGIVPAQDSRSFFYWRLRRRLAVLSLSLQYALPESQVESLITAPSPTPTDESICTWISSNSVALHASLHTQSTAQQIANLHLSLSSHPEGPIPALASLISSLDPSSRSQLVHLLQHQ
jgi:acetyl-CoA carboxylase/biotin carboxylase 1